MKKIILLPLLILFCFSIKAQISVYEMQQPITDVTNQQLNDGNLNPIEGSNLVFDVSPSYTYSHNYAKEVIADQQITIRDASYFKPAGNGSIHFKIDDGNKGVYCFSHTNLMNVRAYDKFELGIDLPSEIEESINQFFATDDSMNYLNPFLEWDVRLRCTFFHVASNTVKEVDGFYSLDYERVPDDTIENWTWSELNTPNPFRIRCAFPELYGQWRAIIELWVNGQEHTFYTPFDVNVVPNPDNKGYVKVGANKQTFDLGGDLFFAIGQNLISPENNGCTWGYNPCSSYYHQKFKTEIDTYAQNGTNVFRVLLNPASIDIEFEKIGNYRDRLNNAWEIDQIVQEAEATGTYIDLNMQFHYSFIDGSPYEMFHWDWSDKHIDDYDDNYTKNMNCYGKDLNLPNPKDFLTDARCKKFYKQKLRYLINRYGYSTNIYLMELISEINSVGAVFTPSWNPGDQHLNSNDHQVPTAYPYNTDVNHVQNTYLWQKEMAEYIKHDLGHTQHMLSCSYAGIPRAEDHSFGIPELDVISYNKYQFYHLDLQQAFSNEVRSYWNQYHKPIIYSETGPGAQYYCDNMISYKQNLWQLSFSGLAGFNMWVADKTNYYTEDKFLANGAQDSVEYFISNIPYWQEARKLQNWIQNDPEKVYALQHAFSGYTVRSPLINNSSYYLKELNVIVGKRQNHTAHKYFGALLNLTDNYYTNSTEPSSWCRDINNNDNLIVKDNITQLKSKQNLDFGDAPINPSYPIQSEVVELDWFRPDNLSYLETTWYEDYNNLYQFEHPLSCVTGTCLNNHPYTSILPFESSLSEPVSEGQMMVNNNIREATKNKELNSDLARSGLGLTIQPNPGSEQITLSSWGEVPEGSEYRLYDLSGRLLIKEPLKYGFADFGIKASAEPTFMAVNTLLTGVYYIHLCSDGQILTTEKWVKSVY